MNFREERLKRLAHIETMLAGFGPDEEGYAATVAAAMNYSLAAGGKRIRPMLMEETRRLFGGPDDEAAKICYPFMAALEMIHTYSLVHDDLPAMDNDEYRRGKKTTHMVYGEALAILAGDGLLNLAFETAVKAFDDCVGEEQMMRVAGALKILGEKAGIRGMLGGQTADIIAENADEAPSVELLGFIHGHKTAALIQSAMMIGGILAGCSPEETSRLERAGYNIGVAFQIQDDILDVTGTFEALGKPIGSDKKNQKLTWVSLIGMAESRKEVAERSQEAIAILRSFPGDSQFLIMLVEAMINRDK